jgi:hypothetical protein
VHIARKSTLSISHPECKRERKERLSMSTPLVKVRKKRRRNGEAKRRSAAFK